MLDLPQVGVCVGRQKLARVRNGVKAPAGACQLDELLHPQVELECALLWRWGLQAEGDKPDWQGRDLHSLMQIASCLAIDRGSEETDRVCVN